MSLLTALGYYLSGQGKARQQSRDNARQDRQDAAASEYQQATLTNDRTRLGMEQTAAAEKKRLDDASMRKENIDPATGQEMPYIIPQQYSQIITREPGSTGNKGIPAIPRDRAAGTPQVNYTREQLAQHYINLANAQTNPVAAKHFMDAAAEVGNVSWRLGQDELSNAKANEIYKGTIPLDQAKANYQQAAAGFMRDRLGVSIQEVDMRDQTARYGADQHLKGEIAIADAHVDAAKLSADANVFAHKLAAWYITNNVKANIAARYAIAGAQAAEALAATQTQANQPSSPLPPMPTAPQPESLKDFLKELKDSGLRLAPLPVRRSGGTAGGSQYQVPDVGPLDGSDDDNPDAPPSPKPSAPATPGPVTSPTPGPAASASASPSPGPSAGSGEEAKIKAAVSAFLASPAAAGKPLEQQWTALKAILDKKPPPPQDYVLAEKLLREQQPSRGGFNPLQAIESTGQNALDAVRSFAGSVMHPPHQATPQPTKILKPLPVPQAAEPVPAPVRTPGETPRPLPITTRKPQPTPTPLPIRTLSPLPFHTPRFSPVQDYQDRLLRGGKVFINDASKFGNQVGNQIVAPGVSALQAYGSRLQRGGQGMMQGASQIGNGVMNGMGKALVPPTPEAQPTAIPTATMPARPALAPLPIATPGAPQIQNPDDELANLLHRLQEILQGRSLF